MKAVVWTDYGEIAVQELAEPQPAPQEILVRVKVAALCKTDIGMIQHGILDIKPPVIVGHEVAGVVESMGADVQGLQHGQLVSLDPPVPCRDCRVCRAGLRHLCPNTQHIGAHTPGGMAEFITIDYRNAYPVPSELSPIAAALTEPFADGLEALSRAGGARGKTVCVFGDGPFGIIICRLAKIQQAGQVILFGHHAERMAIAAGDGVKTYNSRRELNIAGACRSLDQFPSALEAMRKDPARTEALVTHLLRIDDVQTGFELIQNSKSEALKAAIIF